MQAAAAGMVFQEVAGKRVWGTPTLAATGNPSDGEMGQLLTREIKSCGDGNIYMPIYSLMGRCFIMDRCGIAFFLVPQQSSFCWSARGRGVGWGGQCGCVRTVAPHHPPTEARKQEEAMLGQANKPCVTPWSPPMGRGGSKIQPIALI